MVVALFSSPVAQPVDSLRGVVRPAVVGRHGGKACAAMKAGGGSTGKFSAAKAAGTPNGAVVR